MTCRRSISRLCFLNVWLLSLTVTDSITNAEIFRWDNGQVIPGTEGIFPGRGVQLSSRQLEYADFSFIDLIGANFGRSDLFYATLAGSNLTNADLSSSTLTSANLSAAIIAGAKLPFTTRLGFSKEQLYSTASYQQKNLQGIGLGSTSIFGFDVNDPINDLTGWDLGGQNLANANLGGTILRDANLAGAIVEGAHFNGTTPRGFTKEQLYSTASYQQKNLQGIGLGPVVWGFGYAGPRNDLSGWDLSGQNLTNANFAGATLTDANLAGANLTNARFVQSTNGGWTIAVLTNANLSGATVTGANFAATTSHGFTKEQLYSTASYQQRNLQGIVFVGDNLTGWDLSGQDFTNSSLGWTTLTDTNFTGAIVTGADFRNTTSRGFTKEQLYSTMSYQQRQLQGVRLADNILTGWDLSGQDLKNAEFGESTRSGNADLTAADLRGVTGILPVAITTNAIRPDGRVLGLDLAGGDELVVRDDDGRSDPLPGVSRGLCCPLPGRPPLPIAVYGHFAMSDGGMLRVIFDADPWDSLISFQPGIPVQLGGTMNLDFAPEVNLQTQVGRAIRLFNWTDVTPTGTFAVHSPYTWDLSRLYTTGEVTLLAIPEPPATAIIVAGVIAYGVHWRRRFFR